MAWRSTLKPSDWCLVVATCVPMPDVCYCVLAGAGRVLAKVGA